MPGKIKINFKMPPETAAEKMYRKHQELRKKSGLPDPSHYKNLAAQKQKEIDAMKNEEAELLDEMPESSMKTRDVHAHLKKAGWALKRTGGGHDVYAHPKSKEHIAVPRHKQLKAPLIRGIMKASRVSEEVDIDEQLEQKGKFVSGPVKKPYKSPTVASPMREAKDPREYDYEGDMAMSQLRSLMFNAQDMMDLMEDNTNLPEWVQSKITLAEDYISTAANYLRGELNEEVNMNESGGDVVFKKGENHIEKYGEDSFALYKDGKKQKYYTTIDAAKSAMKEDIGLEEASKYAKMFDKMVKQRELNKLPKPPKSEYESKVDKYLKKKYQKEEVELQEGRPSQRHPLEGHDYHKKSNAELIGIAKDAHEAAEAMKGHSTRAENKYRDQANDSATVRYFRQKSGMPDWYKKKYGHVKEDVEIQESDAAWAASQEKRKEKKLTHNDQDKLGQVRALMAREKEAKAKMKKEEVEQLEEKNVPTSPEKWAQAKAQAKSKFDVYPSAYANGWAAKKYKEMGGDWKSVKEETEKPASRKAQIVKDIMKNKKNQEETSDKYQKDPEISSEIQKN
jgi:predicted RNA binding protein YcfA (HicA-like mRNA interferase family)